MYRIESEIDKDYAGEFSYHNLFAYACQLTNMVRVRIRVRVRVSPQPYCNFAALHYSTRTLQYSTLQYTVYGGDRPAMIRAVF